jgi:hypothetical protein
MVRLLKVLGRVAVLGRIAAAHVTARKTEPQMYPGIAGLQALLTSRSAWAHISHLVHMSAFSHATASCTGIAKGRGNTVMLDP